MVFEIKSLKEELGGVDADLKTLASAVQSENRNMSEEEIERFDSLENRKVDIETKLKTAERVSRVSTGTSTLAGSYPAPSVVRSLSSSRPPTKRDQNNALRAWLLNYGPFRGMIQRSWRDAADRCEVNVDGDHLMLRTDFGQDETTSGQGPELQDGSIFQAIELRLKNFGGVRKVAKIRQTENGNPIHYVISDDTGNSASIVGDNTVVASVPQTFTKKVLNAYSFKTDDYPISVELIQDAQTDLLSELGEVLGIRLGRGMNQYYTTGTGSSQPQGAAYAATTAVTTSHSGSMSYSNVNSLFHALDPDYRDSPSCAWMMHDLTLGYLETLTDTSGRPLWLDQEYFSNMATGNSHSSLWGKPVIINNQMAQIGSGNTTILFGDFSRFVVRDVQLPTVQVLRERFADTFSVGVIAYGRTDSILVDANAVQALVQNTAS